MNICTRQDLSADENKKTNLRDLMINKSKEYQQSRPEEGWGFMENWIVEWDNADGIT